MINIKFYLIALNLVFSSIFSNISGQDSLNIKQLNNNLTLQKIQLNPDTCTNKLPQFNFQNRPISNKFWRAMGYSVIYNVSMGIYLVSLPDEITQWHAVDKFKIPVMLNQYKKSFTTPPVIDHDLWFVNYIGHPYQGSYYHNTMRSQGSTFIQSSLYNVFQSVIWEYVWEGGLEPPSIQDMIVTPIAGSMLGELTHRATLSMRRNGFNWYEKVAVCVINPAYAINNGFKTKKKASQFK